MDPCVFCRILAGELPSSPVLDSDLVVAFLDIHPANPGHTLVLPRRHVESFTELSPLEVEQLARCGQRIAAALKQGFDGCEAVTFSLADGAAAGQDVPHTHLHVVPRRTGDGLGWRAAGQLQDREALDATASRLRAALGVSSRVGENKSRT
jgi:histidine triad (HIT) family protein